MFVQGGQSRAVHVHRSSDRGPNRVIAVLRRVPSAHTEGDQSDLNLTPSHELLTPPATVYTPPSLLTLPLALSHRMIVPVTSCDQHTNVTRGLDTSVMM